MGTSSSRDLPETDEEREIRIVVEHTSFDEGDTREYFAAFLAQYPKGFIDRETFVEENVRINGGAPALWAHVYRLIGRSHPLESNATQGFSMASGVPVDSDTQRPKTSWDADADDDESREPLGGGGGGQGAPEEDSPHHRKQTPRLSLATSYTTSAHRDDTDALRGMNFSHVMLRLHRAQFAPAERKLKYLFALFDLDSDGVVRGSDFEVVLGWLHELKAVQQLESFQSLPVEEQENPARRAQAVLALLDRDRDGLLTQDEFLESCRMDNALLDMLTVIAI
jgi:Ca2+-binding EF-hand superfamily protein